MNCGKESMNPKIDLYFDPVDILESSNIKSEMTRTECAFLCGLLRAKGPHKIVEVGVAHGGTTCVILNCLKLMGQKAEIHSVDITDECYRTSGKETGYAVKEVFPDIPSNKETVQNFHEIIRSGRRLLVYGAGDFADKLASYVSLLGYKIEAFVVSDDKRTDTGNRLGNVYRISELPYVKKDCCLIIAMSIEKHCQIQGAIKSKEFHSIFPSEDDDYQRLINYVDDYMAIRCFRRERLYEDTFCSK